MPGEINRIVTDSLSDWFFVTETSGVDNLRREGHAEGKIHHVRHVMVDNVMHQAALLDRSDTASYPTDAVKRQWQAGGGRYGVVTLHRPSNVGDAVNLAAIAGALKIIAADVPLGFPVHPRTRGTLQKAGLAFGPRIHLMDPQPYMSFLHWWKDAAVLLTDSGGLQEETTALGVPCLTLRKKTERPITIDEGSNHRVGTDPAAIVAAARTVLGAGAPPAPRPALWDGQAAGRIVATLVRGLGKS